MAGHERLGAAQRARRSRARGDRAGRPAPGRTARRCPSPTMRDVEHGDVPVGAHGHADRALELARAQAPCAPGPSAGPSPAWRVTSSAWTTTTAGIALAGERRLDPVVGLHDRQAARQASVPNAAVCSPSAGIASATRTPADRTTETTGRASTRSRTQPQAPLAPRAWRLSRHWPGTGRAPSRPGRRASSAAPGTTVTEPSIAAATTRIVPVAKPDERRVAGEVHARPSRP